jgi:hypothetical protein
MAGNNPHRVVLRRSVRRRYPGIDVSIRRGGAEFAEERRSAIARLGVELNRDLLRCDFAEIDRDGEGPSFAVARDSGFSDVKARPVLSQAKLPVPHRPRRLAPI